MEAARRWGTLLELNMSIADQYRARAVACEELAKKARDPELQRNFEEAARQWRNIADIHDRLLAKGPQADQA